MPKQADVRSQAPRSWEIIWSAPTMHFIRVLRIPILTILPFYQSILSTKPRLYHGFPSAGILTGLSLVYLRALRMNKITLYRPDLCQLTTRPTPPFPNIFAVSGLHSEGNQLKNKICSWHQDFCTKVCSHGTCIRSSTSLLDSSNPLGWRVTARDPQQGGFRSKPKAVSNQQLYRNLLAQSPSPPLHLIGIPSAYSILAQILL
jgi:hypothetical protein